MTNEELKTKILDANAAYRAGNPHMSDQEFDALCDALQAQLPEAEWTAFRSRLFETAGKVKHPYPMGSLAKFKYEEPDTLKNWLLDHIKTGLNVSAKVDGISCRLHYENGKLVSATTRGDGTKGENITDKIFKVKYVPKTINTNEVMDIRGELVIFEDDFQGLDFANPRNATAGIMGRKEVTDDLTKISFVAYTVFGTKFTKKEQFDFLEDNYFYPAWHKTIPMNEVNTKTKFDFFSSFNDELRDYVKQPLPYGTDGLVLSDDSYRNEDVLIPEAQIAFKVNESTAETTLIDVQWTGPSKDGKFVPVGIIDPVEIMGTIISKVSLYNIDFVTKNELIPGSKTTICKFGEIIPGVIKVNGKNVIK